MRDRGLTWASGLLRFANWANWLLAASFVVAFVLSFVFGAAIAARLHAKYPAGDVAGTIAVMRVMASLGLVAAVALHQVFTRLLAMVATVRAGDPFVRANADRLRRIGWALLTLQLIDLAIGLIVATLDRMGVDHATWTPAFAGWIAVVMVFVLARVFTAGTTMRDDLAMTV